MTQTTTTMMKQATTVYVHDGVFHADDVLCVALLKCVYDEVKVIRKRINSAEELALIELGVPEGQRWYVLDTGNTDIVSDKLVAFDHHSREKATYKNGVQLAACGKLFKYLVACSMFDLNPEQVESFTKKVLMPVEAQDNGQTGSDFDLGSNLLAWVSTFNSCWNESPVLKVDNVDVKVQDKYFDRAVEIVEEILEHEFLDLSSEEQARKLVEFAIDSSGNDEVVVLPQFIPWQKTITSYNENAVVKVKKLVIVFKSGANWNIQMVPEAAGSFKTICSCPENWRGLKNAELSAQTGIQGSVFCHAAGFMAVFETQEAAIEAAHKVIVNHYVNLGFVVAE